MSRWMDIQVTPWSWLALFAGLLALAWTIDVYRRPLGLISPRWRASLATLRGLAIVVLVLMAFSVRIPEREGIQQSHRIAVMLDESQSMNVIDPKGSTADLLALAEAMGRVTPQKTLDPWAAARRDLGGLIDRANDLRRRRDELEYARLSGRNVETAVRALESESARLSSEFSGWSTRVRAINPPAALPARIDALGAAIRSPAAKDLGKLAVAVDSELAGLVEREEKARWEGQPQLQKVTSDLATLSRRDIGRAIMLQGALAALADAGSRYGFAESLWPIDSDHPPTQPASGIYTDLYESLAQLLARQSGPPLDAIVLLSDGRNTGPTPRLPSAVGAAGVPIYPVLLASGNSGPDVAISRVEVPPAAMVHETIPVRVTVRSRQLKGRTAQITLSSDGVSQSRQATLFDNGSETVEFDLPCESAGEKQLEIQVATQAGESLTSNNRSAAVIHVRDQQTRVAMLSGVAGWDGQYFRNALAQAKWVKLSDESLLNRTCDWTTEQILGQQAIVLANVMPASLTQEQIEAIDRLITTRSGGLIILADDVNVLAAYAAHPLMSRWLPYRTDSDVRWQTWPGETGVVQLMPAPGAEDVQLLGQEGPPGATERRWLARPRLFRLLRVPALKASARPILVDRESNLPVLIEGSTGTGRTLFVGVNELWRWRPEIGSMESDRFLRSLVRQVIEPTYTASAGTLSLGTDRTDIEVGRSLDIRARSSDVDDQHTVGTMQLYIGGELVETRSLNPTLQGSGRYAAAFRATRTGAGEVRFSIAGREGDVRMPLQISASPSRELADVSIDVDTLRRLADATGGRVVPIAKIGDLASEIQRRSVSRDVTMSYDLWASPWAMCAVVGLLCLEWAARKMLGML